MRGSFRPRRSSSRRLRPGHRERRGCHIERRERRGCHIAAATEKLGYRRPRPTILNILTRQGHASRPETLIERGNRHLGGCWRRWSRRRTRAAAAATRAARRCVRCGGGKRRVGEVHQRLALRHTALFPETCCAEIPPAESVGQKQGSGSAYSKDLLILGRSTDRRHQSRPSTASWSICTRHVPWSGSLPRSRDLIRHGT